ncbi:MAG: hypothetical protein RIT27_2484 [Pseudomonadota bacterium]|jgi:hypothetical protein
MNSLAIKKVEITKELNALSETEIDQVKQYVDFLLFQKLPSSRVQTLAGIWKDQGFEKLNNLEQDIYALRQTLSVSILEKDFS